MLNLDQTYTTGAVAQFWGVSPRSAAKLIDRDVVASVKFPGTPTGRSPDRLVTGRALAAWLATAPDYLHCHARRWIAPDKIPPAAMAAIVREASRLAKAG